MEISAQVVKALREKTDAPMMECKKALQEAGGDMGKAEDILRLRLGNKAMRSSSRAVSEGVVAAALSGDQKSGAMVEVNCETDFVARSDAFLAFASQVAELVQRHAPKDMDALLALKMGTGTVDSQRVDLIGKIGENISLRRFVRYGGQHLVTAYIHGGARIGVLLEMSGGDVPLAKDVAMHVAAAKPMVLSQTDLPAEILAKEKEMARQRAEQTAPAGKSSPEMIERVAQGQLKKYFEEVLLLEQPFVKDSTQKVGALLKGRKAEVLHFTLYQLEKKVGTADFAQEVAAQVAQAQKKG